MRAGAAAQQKGRDGQHDHQPHHEGAHETSKLEGALVERGDSLIGIALQEIDDELVADLWKQYPSMETCCCICYL